MRRRLIGLVAAAVVIVLLAFLVPIFLLLRDNAEQRAVRAALTRAQALSSVVGSLSESSLPATAEGGYAVSVFLPDGRVIGVPAQRTASVELAGRCQPITERIDDGVQVLVPVVGVGGCPSVVRVLATDEALGASLSMFYVLVVALSGAVLLAGVLLADRVARGMQRSVADLADAAGRLAAGDLSARVTATGSGEIHQAGREINRLAVRVEEQLAAERRRAADLTHRLRTPLTVLRLDVDSVAEPDARQRLTGDVTAVTRAVDEVIRGARGLASERSNEPADLAELVHDRVAFWSPLAEDTDRKIAVQVDAEPLPVRATRAALTATLDALLGNVFAHTSSGVQLSVTARCVDGGDALLTVDDAGPGFPSGDVVQRGNSGSASTGLGLDIARRTAEASGGSLVLGSSPYGGARVELRLGSPD